MLDRGGLRGGLREVLVDDVEALIIIIIIIIIIR